MYLVSISRHYLKLKTIFFIWLFHAVIKNLCLTQRRPALRWEDTGQTQNHLQVAGRRSHFRAERKQARAELETHSERIGEILSGYCTALAC